MSFTMFFSTAISIRRLSASSPIVLRLSQGKFTEGSFTASIANGHMQYKPRLSVSLSTT